MKFTILSHACLYVEQGDVALMVDPWLRGSAYWRSIVDFAALAHHGVIDPADLDLFAFADTAEEAWAEMVRPGLHAHVPHP